MSKKKKRSKKPPKVRKGLSTARARVWATTHPATWAPSGKMRLWRYEVTDSQGKVVMADCYGAYEDMLREAQEGVAAVRLIENEGHVLRYDVDTLVDLLVKA